jgi:hypothetical protein
MPPFKVINLNFFLIYQILLYDLMIYLNFFRKLKTDPIAPRAIFKFLTVENSGGSVLILVQSSSEISSSKLSSFISGPCVANSTISGAVVVICSRISAVVGVKVAFVFELARFSRISRSRAEPVLTRCCALFWPVSGSSILF